MAPSNPQVVVIGAATSGLTASHALLQDFHILKAKVTLINPTPTFYWNLAAPRIVAKPGAFQAHQYLLPILDAFAHYPADTFEFIIGSATDLDPSAKTVSVTANDGQSLIIPYDHLLIASGATTPATSGEVTGLSIPFKGTGRDDILQNLEKAQKKIASARNIVIGGAGPIGVELAGELADMGTCSITLVSATDRVLHTIRSAASAAAKTQLKKKKVKVILSTRVMGVEGSGDQWVVSLDTGEKLKCDLYIPTTGMTPNNSFIPLSFLGVDGWVKVDDELRVQCSKSDFPLPIYAAGDVNCNATRLSFKAAEQARIAAHNIKVDILRQGERKTFNQGASISMAVPIGENGGTGQYFGLVLLAFMVRHVKGKDFYLSKAPDYLAGNA